MRLVTSCGFLVFRQKPELSFLVLFNRDRMDLPKGHVEAGETDLVTALREFEEETGLSRHQLTVVPDFRHEVEYMLVYRRYRHERVIKRVVVFLGWWMGEGRIHLTEHHAYRWMPWQPPHSFGQGTLDSALQKATPYIQQGPPPAP
jgi:bis(5'-nucleosidyl)-tetraphosphatase